MTWYQRISKKIVQRLRKPSLKSKRLNPKLFGAFSIAVEDEYSWMRSNDKKVFINYIILSFFFFF